MLHNFNNTFQNYLPFNEIAKIKILKISTKNPLYSSKRLKPDSFQKFEKTTTECEKMHNKLAKFKSC